MEEQKKKVYENKLFLDQYMFFIIAHLGEFSLIEILDNPLCVRQLKKNVKDNLKVLKSMINRHYKRTGASKNDIKTAEDAISPNFAAVYEALQYISSVDPEKIDECMKEVEQICEKYLPKKSTNNG